MSLTRAGSAVLAVGLGLAVASGPATAWATPSESADSAGSEASTSAEADSAAPKDDSTQLTGPEASAPQADEQSQKSTESADPETGESPEAASGGDDDDEQDDTVTDIAPESDPASAPNEAPSDDESPSDTEQPSTDSEQMSRRSASPPKPTAATSDAVTPPSDAATTYPTQRQVTRTVSPPTITATVLAAGSPAATTPPSSQAVPVSVAATETTAVGPVRAVVGVVRQVLRTVLSWFGFQSPTTGGSGAAAPLLAGLWEYARRLESIGRELRRTFFNRTPTLPDTMSLTVDGNTAATLATLPTRDADGDLITYTVAAKGQPGGPAHGTVTVSGNTLTYTPDAGYSGADQFTVTGSDAGARFHLHGLASLLRPATAHTDSATVTVTVQRANQAPTVTVTPTGAVDHTTGAVTFVVTAADDATPPGDLTVTVTQPADGTGTVSAPVFDSGAGTWGFTYTPAPQERIDAYATDDVTEQDRFTVTVADAETLSRTEEVVVEIDPKAPPLSAVDDAATTNEDTPVTVDVLVNDSVPEGGLLTIEAAPEHGTASIVGDTIVYTPDPDYSGEDALTYRVSTGATTTTATVYLTVTPVDDPAIAGDDDFTTTEGVPLTIAPSQLLANDDDVDNALSVTDVGAPSHGTVTVNATTGDITYTPDTGFVGVDQFTYSVSDGNPATEDPVATVRITVDQDPSEPVNVTDASFESVVLASGLPVLVEFWAEWCGPCRTMAPIIDEAAEQLAGEVTVAKLNVDENPLTPEEYGVQSLPTMILFENGQPVAYIVGFTPLDDLLDEIDQYVL